MRIICYPAGRTLKGKTCRNPSNIHRPYHVISGQAVLYHSDEYWGCCPHHGKRVLELQEFHFTDAAPGQDWHLYLVGSWLSPTHAIHDFFLLPENQTYIDLARNTSVEGWSFVGSAKASMIRMELDEMLRHTLELNDQYGYRYHHVHIDIMMNEAYDRETPRNRKMNNERVRADRKNGQQPGLHQHHHEQQRHQDHVTYQEWSESATDETASTTERENEPSSVGKVNDHRSHHRNNPFVNKQTAAPPIPHVISNDSSLFSHSVASTVAMTSYHDLTAEQTAAVGYWTWGSTPLMNQSHQPVGHNKYHLSGGQRGGGGGGGAIMTATGCIGPDGRPISEYHSAEMHWLPGNAPHHQHHHHDAPPLAGFNTVHSATPHHPYPWGHQITPVPPAAVPPLLGPHTLVSSHCGHPPPSQPHHHANSFPDMRDMEQYLLYQEPLTSGHDGDFCGSSPHLQQQAQYQPMMGGFLPMSGPPPTYDHRRQQQQHHHVPTVPREILSQPIAGAHSSAISASSLLSGSVVSTGTTTETVLDGSKAAGPTSSPDLTTTGADYGGGGTGGGIESTNSSTSTATAANTTSVPATNSPSTAATSPSWTKGRGAGLPPRRSEANHHSD